MKSQWACKESAVHLSAGSVDTSPRGSPSDSTPLLSPLLPHQQHLSLTFSSLGPHTHPETQRPPGPPLGTGIQDSHLALKCRLLLLKRPPAPLEHFPHPSLGTPTRRAEASAQEAAYVLDQRLHNLVAVMTCDLTISAMLSSGRPYQRRPEDQG